jgi:hypothetical protein
MRARDDEERVGIVDWISAEPAAVLASKSVVVAVHHGGASSYHKAIRSVMILFLPFVHYCGSQDHQ